MTVLIILLTSVLISSVILIFLMWTNETRLVKELIELESENLELTERIEFALSYLPECPQTAIDVLKPAIKEQKK